MGISGIIAILTAGVVMGGFLMLGIIDLIKAIKNHKLNVKK